MTLSVMEAGIAEPLDISVVLSEEGGVYQEFAEALRSNLGKQTAVVSITNIGQPTLSEPDLVIAVGTKAATAMAATSLHPVLNVFLSKETFSKLQKDNLKRTNPFSAIYLDQPVERQVSLIKSALPNASHIGLLYSHPSPELRTLHAKATEHKLVLHEQEVSAGNSLPSALQEILKTSDVILALPDTEIYNATTIRNILLAAYRSQVPMIGFSASFVRAGAVCAVYTTPGQFATQAASAIRQFAESRTLPVAQYAHEFEIQVNLQVARSLGLNIPNATDMKYELGGQK